MTGATRGGMAAPSRTQPVPVPAQSSSPAALVEQIRVGCRIAGRSQVAPAILVA